MKPSDPKPTNVLVHRSRDDDDDEQFKPLEWGLIRRLFGYTHVVARKRNWLIVLSAIRSVQLAALVWLAAEIINGPIAHRDSPGLILGIAGYALLAIATDG
ncbi:MAG TPA: ABC transporter ATP-binding protein, partial [Opitutus sp.]|nr:ABC transporter ATP-binding protein [Opitutus sp.]